MHLVCVRYMLRARQSFVMDDDRYTWIKHVSDFDLGQLGDTNISRMRNP